MSIAAWAVPIAVAALAWAGSGLLVRVLTERNILDHPNTRSSHDRPTPRGAGLALVGALAVGWGIAHILGLDGMGPPVLWLAMLALAVVSWVDDLRGLGAVSRLAAQALAIAAVLFAGGLDIPFPPWLPAWAGFGLAGFAWLWFVNLFNFMDGIDGLSGIETLCIGGGAALVIAVTPLAGAPFALATALGAAALGFLPWNWSPARIFLGDVGSVPLGFLIGWLLLTLAADGAWAAALLLPAYYLADATVTLARRLRSGARPWQAHREHFYQQAVRRGLGHAAVAGRVVLLDLVLVGCAIVAGFGLFALMGASIVGSVSTVALLCYFRGPAPANRPGMERDSRRP